MGIFPFGKTSKSRGRKNSNRRDYDPDKLAQEQQQHDDDDAEPGQTKKESKNSSLVMTASSSSGRPATEQFFRRASAAGWMLEGSGSLSFAQGYSTSRAFLTSGGSSVRQDSVGGTSASNNSSNSTTKQLSAQFTSKVQELRNQRNSIHVRHKLDLLKVGQLAFFPNASLVGRDEEVERLKAIVNSHIAEKRQQAAADHDDGKEKTTVPNTTTTSRLILITGTSGSGKTVLARQLERHVLDKTAGSGGDSNYFLLGKFDQQYDQYLSSNDSSGGGAAQPYTAFAEASHQLANQILINDQKQNKGNESSSRRPMMGMMAASGDCDLKQRIEQAVGSQGIDLLLEIFPGLSRVIETTTTSSESSRSSGALSTTSSNADHREQQYQGDHIESKTNQLEFTARQLFRVLSRNTHDKNYENKESSSSSPTATPLPVVVLVLDGVQWADQQSLNLVEALMTDREFSFILIATARSNELNIPTAASKHNHKDVDKDEDDMHPFVTTMDNLRKAKIPIETIEIGDLTKTAVRSVVARALNSMDNDTDADNEMDNLASVVYQKTNGNAFFVVQFLNMLVQENLLTFNIGLVKWIWDNEAIQNLTVADNVGSLLASKIAKLPNQMQTLLKIASCLGPTFEKEILSVAVRSLVEMDAILSVQTADAVTDSIPACAELGLIVEASGTKYRIAHDQIQAASFRLISQDELPKMQLTIGRGLANYIATGGYKDKKREDLLYLTVDLCNRGRSLITDDTDRISMAFQNLRAAEKAVHKSSAFDAGIAYAKYGILCLEEPESLTTEGDLVKHLRLRLHTAWAEAAYCIGDHHTTAVYSNMIIDSDFPFADRFIGYSTRMMLQFSMAQMDASMETSLFILKKLKCIKNLATYPSTMRIMMEVMKTKKLMKSYTHEDLLNLPPMTDETRLRAMNIVYRTATMTHAQNPNLFLVLFLTALRWTVKYGVCKYSPPVFAIYGLVLCGALEDFDAGTMIGEVALALSERLQAPQTVALTTSVVFAFVNHWKNDLRAARKPLEYGYLTGLQVGDLGNAFICLIAHDQNSWLVGYPGLLELERTVRESVAKIRSCGHEYFAAEHCCTWQLVLNLLGRCEDPLVLTGEAMDQEEMRKGGIATNHKTLIVSIFSFGGYLGYLYENYEHAVAELKQLKKEDCLGYWTLPRLFSTLALAYIGLAQEGKRVRYNIAKARALIKNMKKWLEKGNPFLNHLVCLMDAEIASVLKPHSAALMYETAIKLASRAGFRHDAALAHHRAARFYFVVMNDENWGSFHIDRSINAYCEWGAFGVARHLATKYVVTAQGGGKSGFFSEEITMCDNTREIVSGIMTTDSYGRRV